jgi:hypothetical protein
MSILTTRQREMLVLTVQAGYCVYYIPASYHAAWTARGRGGSADFEFSEKTGHILLSLGLIQLEPGAEPPRCCRSLEEPLVMVRYVPTVRAVAKVAKILAGAVA